MRTTFSAITIASILAWSPTGSTAEFRDVHQRFEPSAPLAGELDGLAIDGRGLVISAVGPQGAAGIYTSGAVAAPFAFNAVGPHWRAQVPEGTWLRIELSTSADGVEWSPYRDVLPDEHMVPNELLPDGTANPSFGDTVGGLWTRSLGDGHYVRYRVHAGREAGVDATPVLERFSLAFIDSREPHPQAAAEPETIIAHAGDGAAYPKPPVYSRSQWGAAPPNCTYSYCNVTHIAIHHTAGVAEYSCNGFSDCSADVRAIQSFHQNVNGWCDVGYNYLASSDGALWEGRGGGDDVRGAHDGFNCGSMAISNMGYYHSPYNHNWTEAQLDSVADLSAWKCDQKGIDPFGRSFYSGYGANQDNIYGHRDVSSTACPGDNIYSRLGELKNRVDQKLNGGGGGQVFTFDNPGAITRGEWVTGTTAGDKFGSDYFWTSTGTADDRWCAFPVTLTSSGTYEVSFWWTQGSNRNPNTEVGIKQGALQTFTVNQQINGGQWNSIGSFFFSSGLVYGGVLNDGPGGFIVVCDAVRFTKLSD